MRVHWPAIPILLLAVACFPTPPSASQRLNYAATDLNDAARFGRMDVAADLTSPDEQGEFAKRRLQWGRNVRVVGVQLAGIEMGDKENADVTVEIAWTRMDEGTLRSTQIRQAWQDQPGAGWVLVKEKRLDGDLGLFGEEVVELPREPVRDVHFPTKTIR